MTSENSKEKWEKERDRVLDEWSDIELRFQNNGVPASTTSPCISLNEEKLPFSEKTIFENSDALVHRLLSFDYSREKSLIAEELKTMALNQQNYFGANLIKSCVCRPGVGAESLKSSLEDERLLLLALSSKSYSNSIAEHWHLLSEIFRKCTRMINDNIEMPCDRSGGHWETIGFQGADPSTDLRASGMLGLLQLYSFVTQSATDDVLRIILRMAHDRDQNFPFAVVGINFTGQIIERLKAGTFNDVCNHFNSVLQAITAIYRGCFFEFYNRWHQNRCTIVDFQTTLSAISKILDKNASQLVDVKFLAE